MLLQRDFTLPAYERLVDSVIAAGLGIYGVLDWMRNPPPSGAVIRHDVDRRPLNALAMARSEAGRGVRTTYYFRVVGTAMNPDVIAEVASLGHEVGYHYEDLALAKGDIRRAGELFAKHLEQLRRIAPIATIAMHGSPLSRWNNLDMWDTFDFRDFGLVGEAFLSIDYQGCAYLTDTGRSWQASNTNLRDRPRGAYMVRDGVRSTADLIRLIGEGELPRMAISVHPERWDDRLDGWLLQLGKDTAINGVKRVLSMARSHA